MSSRLIIFIAAIAALQVAHAKPDPTKCHVENLNTEVTYGANLQDALDAATTGDVLQIKGTCVGNFTINSKNLTLQGKASKKAPSPTLDGNQTGSVINAVGGTLDLIDLVITNGVASCNHADYCVAYGGGINAQSGAVNLHGTTVTGNTVSCTADRCGAGGGGISARSGTVNLHGTTTITGNTASCTSAGTDVSSVCLAQGGGIYAYTFGFNTSQYTTLNDQSSVTGNTVSCNTTGSRGFGTECYASGGGIHNENGHFNNGVATAITTLNHQSSVTGNTAAATVGGLACTPNGGGFPDPCRVSGGGIYNLASGSLVIGTDVSQVILNDSSVVSGNTPDQYVEN